MSYAKEISKPKDMREGLGNAVQIIINCLERGDAQEALLQAVNLLDDVRSESNPYRIDVKGVRTRLHRASLPRYDSQRDGDYSAWLVANNMD